MLKSQVDSVSQKNQPGFLWLLCNTRT